MMAVMVGVTVAMVVGVTVVAAVVVLERSHFYILPSFLPHCKKEPLKLVMVIFLP
jgi:hypothetical protein